MTPTRLTMHESRLEKIFMSVNAASIVAILLFGVFYLSFIITHEGLFQEIQDALSNWDFVKLQTVLDAVFRGVMGADGWVRVAIGMGMLFLSFLFILNTAGIVFSVFIHRPFTAGGTPTIKWWRLSISRAYLTLRLLLFIALYKTTGLTGFSILQDYFPDNPILNVAFFFNSALSLGTLVVLASVIKVVVYEISRYESLIESNRQSVVDALREYAHKWRNEMILLDEAICSRSHEYGYVKAKLEDATRAMKADIRLVERSMNDLERIASPKDIIRKLFLAFIVVVIMQIIADIVLYIGWGTVLEYFMGWIR